MLPFIVVLLVVALLVETTLYRRRAAHLRSQAPRVSRLDAARRDRCVARRQRRPRRPGVQHRCQPVRQRRPACDVASRRCTTAWSRSTRQS